MDKQTKAPAPKFHDMPMAIAEAADFVKAHPDVTPAEWDQMADLAESCSLKHRPVEVSPSLGDVALGAFILTNYSDQTLEHLLQTIREWPVKNHA